MLPEGEERLLGWIGIIGVMLSSRFVTPFLSGTTTTTTNEYIGPIICCVT